MKEIKKTVEEYFAFLKKRLERKIIREKTIKELVCTLFETRITITYWNFIIILSSIIFSAWFLSNFRLIESFFNSNIRVLYLLIAFVSVLSFINFRLQRDIIAVFIVSLAVVALAATSISFSSFVFPKPPIQSSLPTDYGFSLIGLIPLFLLGFLLSKHFFDLTDLTDHFLMSMGMGSGLISLIMIILGIFGLISLSIILLIQFTMILLLILVDRSKLRKSLKNTPSAPKNALKQILNLSGVGKLVILWVSVVITYATYQALAYPPIEWDSMAYGVNWAKLIFENHRIPVISGPSIGLEISANYPPGMQVLAVYFYLFAGSAFDFYFRFLPPLFGFATLLLVYKMGLTVADSRKYALFALIGVTATPLFWKSFIIDYPYISYLTFSFTLTLYCLLMAFKLNNRSYEITAAFFAGVSSLISYLGLISIGFLMIYAIIRKLHFKRLILLSVSTLIIASLWYMRNFLCLSNPIYPFVGFGKNLNPLLYKSTTMHFENYKRGGLSFVESMISDYLYLAPLPLFFLIFYLAVLPIRRKHGTSFLDGLSSQSFLLNLEYSCGYAVLTLISFSLFHVFFPRYLVCFIPLFFVLFTFLVKIMLTHIKFKYRKVLSTALVLFLIWLSFFNFLFLSSIKTPKHLVNDEYEYLGQFYPEADAWRWIAKEVPSDVRVATYDIREYYMDRRPMLLDGQEAVPIYHMSDIDEVINYMKEHQVEYILSVPWTSPQNPQMLPPAYTWSPITKYLGDPDYFPLVYMSLSGAAIYHVGSINHRKFYELWFEKDLITPKQLKLNMTITNSTSPPAAMKYVAIPVDYTEGLVKISSISNGHNISVELFEGLVLKGTPGWWTQYKMVARAPTAYMGRGEPNASLVWDISKGGYYTLVIAYWGKNIPGEKLTLKEKINVTLSIDFCTKFEDWLLTPTSTPTPMDFWEDFLPHSSSFPVKHDEDSFHE